MIDRKHFTKKRLASIVIWPHGKVKVMSDDDILLGVCKIMKEPHVAILDKTALPINDKKDWHVIYIPLESIDGFILNLQEMKERIGQRGEKQGHNTDETGT